MAELGRVPTLAACASLKSHPSMKVSLPGCTAARNASFRTSPRSSSELGHDVTLFASGDSVTNAELDATCSRALRLDPTCHDFDTPHVLLLERVLQRAHEFDLIHWHIEGFFPALRRLDVPHLTTLHGRLDRPSLAALYAEFDDIPVVSISDAQRAPLPGARWCGTVHHGLPGDAASASPEPGDYFAFFGPDLSGEARRSRDRDREALEVPLKIAAKIDRADAEYFRTRIEPLLDHPLIEFIGEIGEREKTASSARRARLLFPIDWPEPFGLVMIEAMACGTPVVAMSRGSVPEIIQPGVNGFCADSMEAAVAAAARVSEIRSCGLPQTLRAPILCPPHGSGLTSKCIGR